MSKLSLTIAVSLLTAAALAGCTDRSQSPDAAAPGTQQASPSAAVSSRPPSPTISAPTASPVELPGELRRCGAQPARVTRAATSQFTLRGPHRARLPAASIGRGRTVAVFLHQTDGDGLCGWLDFASRTAGRRGVAALVFDLCGYGGATCADSDFGYDQVAQVRLAVEHAREAMGAKTVVLVGASMGGSVAVLAAGDRVDIDRFADLSGPTLWHGRTLASAVRAATVPGLFAYARSDGVTGFAQTKKLAATAPAGSRFVGADSGHGYQLLLDYRGRMLPTGRLLLDWVSRGPVR